MHQNPGNPALAAHQARRTATRQPATTWAKPPGENAHSKHDANTQVKRQAKAALGRPLEDSQRGTLTCVRQMMTQHDLGARRWPLLSAGPSLAVHVGSPLVAERLDDRWNGRQDGAKVARTAGMTTGVAALSQTTMNPVRPMTARATTTPARTMRRSLLCIFRGLLERCEDPGPILAS